MTAETPLNPYQPQPDQAAPFAGRHDAFMRLHQYLKDPSNGGALVFTGWPMVGKTAFLHQFNRMFDDTQIGVYIPLKTVVNEVEFLRTLIEETIGTLAVRDFTLSRVPSIPAQVEDWRVWLAESWLPEVRSAIRHHRQIVWLLDDVQALASSVQAGQVKDDLFRYFQYLLGEYPHLRLVMTLDIDDENSLRLMGDLVKPTHIVRLNYLSRLETAALLREPVAEYYAFTEDAADEVYRATGGRPHWAQRFGFHLFERQHSKLVTAGDVKVVIPTVYRQTLDELESLWRGLTDAQRLILSAIGSLLYNDPLSRVNSGAIAQWLVDTDYPMDETSVNAAIRSLEYREILDFSGPDLSQIQMKPGLLQRWVIENARLTEKPRMTVRLSNPQWLGLLIAVVLVIVILIAVSLGSPPQQPGVSNSLPPTVTLVSPQP